MKIQPLLREKSNSNEMSYPKITVHFGHDDIANTHIT